jgi:hypothetical protein
MKTLEENAVTGDRRFFLWKKIQTDDVLRHRTKVTNSVLYPPIPKAERDYAEINRMTEMTAYQAKAAERLFGQIGLAESMGIRAKLIADAYGRGGKAREQLTSAFQKIRSAGGLREVIGAQRLLLKPRKVLSREEVKQQVTSVGLLEWFRSLGDTQDGTREGEGTHD